MPIIIAQKRSSEYNDKIGANYHYPKRYWSLISEGVPFVYYHPKEQGDGERYYFGYGKIGTITLDTTVVDHRYADITDYVKFDTSVPYKLGGNYVEDGNTTASPSRKQPPFQKAVRRIDEDTYKWILRLARGES